MAGPLSSLKRTLSCSPSPSSPCSPRVARAHRSTSRLRSWPTPAPTASFRPRPGDNVCQTGEPARTVRTIAVSARRAATASATRPRTQLVPARDTCPAAATASARAAKTAPVRLCGKCACGDGRQRRPRPASPARTTAASARAAATRLQGRRVLRRARDCGVRAVCGNASASSSRRVQPQPRLWAVHRELLPGAHLRVQARAARTRRTSASVRGQPRLGAVDAGSSRPGVQLRHPEGFRKAARFNHPEGMLDRNRRASVHLQVSAGATRRGVTRRDGSRHWRERSGPSSCPTPVPASRYPSNRPPRHRAASRRRSPRTSGRRACRGRLVDRDLHDRAAGEPLMSLRRRSSGALDRRRASR